MRSLLLAALLAASAAAKTQIVRATAVLQKSVEGGYPTEVVGVINFYQGSGSVFLNGTINGLTVGEHGFHIHEKGDLGNGCLNSGGHYNPKNVTHGAKDAATRHYGDLGNINAANTAPTFVQMSDSYLTLNGDYSIIGRALVVHAGRDDLGLGNDPSSLVNGNAGARYACGIVVIEEEEDVDSSPSLLSLSFLFILFTPFLFLK